jgi:thioredoxin 1
MTRVVTINDGNFDSEILQSNKPVGVLFKTEGCPYCRAMKPVMEQVAEEFGDRLKIAFIDAFDSPEMTAEYGIQAVPQLIFFRDGQVTESVLGARPKEEIVDKIKNVLEQPAIAKS